MIDIVMPPPARIDCYFLHSKNRYFYFNALKEKWEFLSASSLEVELRQLGFNHLTPPGSGIPETKMETRRIEKEHSIDGAAALGWLEPGVHDVEGQEILVTRGAKLIEPEAGEWQTVYHVLYNLLGEEQLAYFLSWMKCAVEGLYGKRQKRVGQAVVFVGPSDSGKSLVQDQLITPCLGGKAGKPWEWLQGMTQFNSELFEACHLKVEDEASRGDFTARREIGVAIKKLTANKEQRFHEKGLPAFTAKPFWRLTMSLNDRPDDISVLPTLSESLENKLIVFKCERHEMPVASEHLDAAFKDELPAFLHFILEEYQIPEELKDERYGVKEYMDPEVRRELEGIGPEVLLYDVLKSLYGHQSKPVKWSLGHVMTDVENARPPEALRSLLKYTYKFAGMMRKLSEAYPKQLAYKQDRKAGGTGERFWFIDFNAR